MIDTVFDKDYVDKLKEYLVDKELFKETSPNIMLVPSDNYSGISKDIIEYAKSVGIHIGPDFIVEVYGETYWDCGE